MVVGSCHVSVSSVAFAWGTAVLPKASLACYRGVINLSEANRNFKKICLATLRA